MNNYLRRALIVLIISFALFSIIGTITDAFAELSNLSPFLFVFGAFLFIASILVWVLAWSLLIKKRSNVSVKKTLLIGFSSVYGAITPMQLGAEALRSIQAKHYLKVPYSDSVSSSMFAKGLKFLVLLVIAFIVLTSFFSSIRFDALQLFGFLSGLFVVSLASFLFLLPLNKSFGLSISSFFNKLSKNFSFLLPVSKFFEGYSSFLENTTISSLFLTLFLVSFSLLLEIFSLQFAFYSLSISIGLKSLAIFFIVSSILERTPFLPRGIGIVEIVGASLLSIPEFVRYGISFQEIGAVLIVFGLFRLVIPTISSLAVLFASSSYLNKSVNRKP